MYNNGYMNGLTSKVTLAMRGMQTSVNNRRFAKELNNPKVLTPSNGGNTKKDINNPYAPKGTTRPSRVLDDVYFRLVRTKQSLGTNIPMDDSMIITFKDKNNQPIQIYKDKDKDKDKNNQPNKMQDVHIVGNGIDYLSDVRRIALKYEAGVIKYAGGVMTVSARPMRKRYIDAEKQKRLLDEGYAIRVSKPERF